jgi:hypothetical protein
MRKIIVAILLVLTTLFIGFWAVGALANESYSGQLSKKFNASPERLWAVISDFTELQKGRREIVKIEILQTDSLGPVKWKEFTDMDGFIVFERVEMHPNKMLKLKMLSSSFGMSGFWTYSIEAADNQSKLIIAEQSIVEQAVVRSALVLAGRDANLKQEMSLITAALSK